MWTVSRIIRRHLICRDCKHLAVVKLPVFDSGYWDVPLENAQELVGGNLFLHESKAAMSHHGGRVIHVRLADASTNYPGRVIFRFEALAEAKGRKWEGKAHKMANDSGNIDDYETVIAIFKSVPLAPDTT